MRRLPAILALIVMLGAGVPAQAADHPGARAALKILTTGLAVAGTTSYCLDKTAFDPKLVDAWNSWNARHEGMMRLVMALLSSQGALTDELEAEINRTTRERVLTHFADSRGDTLATVKTCIAWRDELMRGKWDMADRPDTGADWALIEQALQKARR
ncbi:MAG: hypothetical protein U9N14_04065 [Pseudomonadota bacterium]|nr:hypothetical protein [Pseudomonadota bacterium]